MATERQIAANRANAKKSTGPNTPEGKGKSSANSTRDALTAQICLMPDEDRTAHDAFCDELIADLLPDSTPAPALERQLAQSIAEDNWRLNRIKATETTLFHSGTAEAFVDDTKKLQLLTLYIQRTSREIHRNLQLLRELQTERKTARAAALKQAADLLALHRMKNPQTKEQLARGVPPAPPPDEICPVNGFVFSHAEIEAAMTRNRHIRESALAAECRFKRESYERRGGSLAA